MTAMARFVPTLFAACFAASCVNCSGLEGDGTAYTPAVRDRERRHVQLLRVSTGRRSEGGFEPAAFEP